MDFVLLDVLNTAVALNFIYCWPERKHWERGSAVLCSKTRIGFLVFHGLFCDLGQLIIFLGEEKNPHLMQKLPFTSKRCWHRMMRNAIEM